MTALDMPCLDMSHRRPPPLSLPSEHSGSSFDAWINQIREIVDQALRTHLTFAPDHATPLQEAMSYATLGGGKRIRPLLVFATGEMFEAPASNLSRCAAAVEMIHVNSLVHDDMPCMDNDVLRHGKPTVHIQYGEATALLVGDALQSQAFFVLSDNQGVIDAERQLLMTQLLAQTIGSTGMCAGQAIDLDSQGKTISLHELENMHRLKTGTLLRAAVLLGAMCGKRLLTSEISALDTYSQAIGLAFQITDDVLDATADANALGKTVGKDVRDGKPTYATLLGPDQAKATAEALLEKAHNALDPFGQRARRLHELADLMVGRQI